MRQASGRFYEVGFNHFWRAKSASHPGDMIFMQGHSSPGTLRARLSRRPLGRKPAAALARKVKGGGLSSYPHPWLMPDFWQFSHRIDGIGSDDGHFPGALRALPRASRHRSPIRPQGLGVPGRRQAGTRFPNRWASPPMPVREKLDNPHLRGHQLGEFRQRLDGPRYAATRKIIQELEAAFLGAGWNVIKVHVGFALGSIARAAITRDCSSA